MSIVLTDTQYVQIMSCHIHLLHNLHFQDLQKQTNSISFFNSYQCHVVYIHSIYSYNQPSFHLGGNGDLKHFSNLISWYLFSFVKLLHSNIQIQCVTILLTCLNIHQKYYTPYVHAASQENMLVELSMYGIMR